MWISGGSKAINKYMKNFLEDSLDNISSFLCVSPDLSHVVCAFHKEFSLTTNYHKGHGENFRDWMIKHYPYEFLIHAERASGRRQDIVIMDAGPVYWNRLFNIEFFDTVI